jgi:hypothetical protein
MLHFIAPLHGGRKLLPMKKISHIKKGEGRWKKKDT